MAGYLALLDRDGTINEEADLLHSMDELRLLPGAAEGIAALNRCGIKIAIVTNQPVVARGLCTEDDVRAMNSRLLSMLAERGARIDAVYFCPHHPERGHSEADDPKFRRDCECRKPKTGMLVQASERFGIPPGRCFMIGDSTRDILAGKNFGCRTILVQTGYAGKDGRFDAKPDFVRPGLKECAELVCSIAEASG